MHIVQSRCSLDMQHVVNVVSCRVLLLVVV